MTTDDSRKYPYQLHVPWAASCILNHHCLAIRNSKFFIPHAFGIPQSKTFTNFIILENPGEKFLILKKYKKTGSRLLDL